MPRWTARPARGDRCTVAQWTRGDPITGVANVLRRTSLCDDNDVCTGIETCDAVLDCQAGTPLDDRTTVLSCTVRHVRSDYRGRACADR